MKSLKSALKEYKYPGRGIIMGLEKNGNFLIGYFITGRSISSKNRILKLDSEGNARTVEFERNENTKNKDLILYKAISKFNTYTIITNGNHTDTILDGLKYEKTFEESLKTRTFEEDPPIFTPRISGILNIADEKIEYKLSIIKKSSKENSDNVERFYFEYEGGEKGVGHLIHTYKQQDENNINSFYGEPTKINLPESFNEFANTIWLSLNEEYRVSVFVRLIDVKAKKEYTKIINKNS